MKMTEKIVLAQGLSSAGAYYLFMGMKPAALVLQAVSLWVLSQLLQKKRKAGALLFVSVSFAAVLQTFLVLGKMDAARSEWFVLTFVKGAAGALWTALFMEKNNYRQQDQKEQVRMKLDLLALFILMMAWVVPSSWQSGWMYASTEASFAFFFTVLWVFFPSVFGSALGRVLARAKEKERKKTKNKIRESLWINL